MAGDVQITQVENFHITLQAVEMILFNEDLNSEQKLDCIEQLVTEALDNIENN